MRCNSTPRRLGRHGACPTECKILLRALFVSVVSHCRPRTSKLQIGLRPRLARTSSVFELTGAMGGLPALAFQAPRKNTGTQPVTRSLTEHWEPSDQFAPSPSTDCLTAVRVRANFVAPRHIERSASRHFDGGFYHQVCRGDGSGRWSGGLAQLGERLNGIQEVRGSNPLSSTSQATTQPRVVSWLFSCVDGAKCQR